MNQANALPELSVRTYVRHALHAEDRNWSEKNCYGDLWIEFLHSQQLEPRAMLPFTLTVDFEGDQWTFYKPPLAELRDLYGIVVQEMTVWRPLLEHALEHLGAGRLICTEADAFWLPDMAGSDYRRKHTKSTIMLVDIDAKQRRLGYFHNAGYYELRNEDFVKTFRLDEPHDPNHMPFFAELVRIDRMHRRPEDQLAAMSMDLLRRHMAWRPSSNPFDRFGQRLAAEMPGWKEEGLARYHAWTFATVRQAGSAFELAAENLRWLSAHGQGDLIPAAERCENIAAACKSLILKGARAACSGRLFDVHAMLGPMARDWDEAMALVGCSIY